MRAAWDLARTPGGVMRPYPEGDWFVVPLRRSGFAVGMIIRANPKAALLGCLFGPRRESDVASRRSPVWSRRTPG
jgi:hypothetical protein